MSIDTEELTGAAPAEHAAPHIEEELRAAEAAAGAEESEVEEEALPLRLVAAVAMPTIAAGIMVGGIFEGIGPRFYAVFAGLLGIGLASLASRLMRRPLVAYGLILAGLFAIGLVLLLPDFSKIFNVTGVVSAATSQADVLRPPVPFDPGWKPVIGWLLGIVGFTAAWLSIVVGARSIGLLLPLPIAAVAGISVPDSQQVMSGVAVLVLFAVGLGLLSSQNSVGDDDSISPGMGYELRKAAKALPIVIGLVIALVFGQSYLGFLFPDPIIDPAQEPQKPRTRPLSEVEDRVLFEVRDAIIDGTLVTAPTGPFRTGVLDVYDGEFWRLPPFASSEIADVKSDGLLDPTRAQVSAASITVRGLSGLVLPGLPNSAAIAASGVDIGFDARSGTVRMVNGQVPAGLSYLITASGIPSILDLRAADSAEIPASVREFTDIPAPPPAVTSLIAQAETLAAGPSRWDRFDWLRTWILDNVTASGAGTPIGVTPARVDDMIAGSQSGSPFEIVAAQAMLARWIGIPSRIGFGFDGGKKVGDALEVRPIHGAAWVEVYFGDFGWLPVIGTPKKAEPSVGSDPSLQRFDPNILPGNDVGTQIYIPLLVPPPSVLGEQIAVSVLSALPIIALLLALYFAYPAVRKMRLRGRRRQAALRSGVRARIALAYSEFRDYATDLGYRFPTDTPLMFLERCMDDEEHRELAWITTRVLWGDLRDETDTVLATTAEELSRSLRRRMGASQPGSVRALAVISRLSLRNPYDPAHEHQPSTGRARFRLRRRSSAVVPA